MSKAKWKHKSAIVDTNLQYYKFPVCGQATIRQTETYWKNVTCPKCLAKKSKKKQEKTDLYWVLDGGVSLVEKKENGEEISREKIDGLLVVQCLNDLLEKGLKAQLQWAAYGKESINEKNRAK